MIDDLTIHKMAKAQQDAKKRIDNCLNLLKELEQSQEKVTILSVIIELEKLKRILDYV